jgi:hypothetical protein
MKKKWIGIGTGNWYRVLMKQTSWFGLRLSWLEGAPSDN